VWSDNHPPTSRSFMLSSATSIMCRYGYDYPCLASNSSAPASTPMPNTDVGHGDVCELRAVPFVGAPCSDAAGSQRPFSEIMASE
jgi:hypothetical protein